MPPKKRILILCTGNSCRSQMAEGILRHFHSDRYEVASAGTKPSSVNPIAIQVMKEIGIDISNHSSKSIDTFKNKSFDYVVTVCDHVRETCPFFPAKEHLHWPFPDPPHNQQISDDVINQFRHVRDLIYEQFKNCSL